ncbi:MAG: hypothetical protein KGY42_01360 [Desulfobacterales bacterium]|nr:hypothetical protein [Desulfobacterales bacterium]MBS3755104.1 hypothetical protein [Desulfobacterales bacterium]
MEREKKTNSEFIIDALHTGRELRSPEITRKVAEDSGKNIKIQDIASILAKLSNSEKCDLGFFIQKQKTHKGYTYSLVPDAVNLPAEALYDLTRKTGKNRYTLEHIIAEHPELKRYVKSSRMKNRTVKQSSKRARKPAAASASEARQTRISGNAAENGPSDQALQALIARLIEEVSYQGGLNINVNLTVRFAGIDTSEPS